MLYQDGRLEQFFCRIDHGASLAPRYVGHEQCARGKRWSGVRDHFVLHFVASGTGVARMGRRMAAVPAGSVFLYGPDEYMDYRADQADPWRYMWVGFSGEDADGIVGGLLGNRPRAGIGSFLDAPLARGLMQDLIATIAARHRGYRTKATGLLNLLLAEVARGDLWSPGASAPTTQSDASALVNEALEFIKGNFQQFITVSDVVRYIGLERSYLGRLFRSHVGSTIQGCILEHRMKEARRLVLDGELPIASIATSVGFNSYEVFERNYKRTFSESPRATRRERTPAG